MSHDLFSQATIFESMVGLTRSWWGSRQAKLSSDSGEKGVDKRLHSAVNCSSGQSFNGLLNLWWYRDLNAAMRSTDQLPVLLVTKNIRYATGSPVKGEDYWRVRRPRIPAN